MGESFEEKAASWDDDPHRLQRARNVAAAVRAAVPIVGSPVTAELGAGTGMLSRCLADVLGPTTLLDASPAMTAAAAAAIERERLEGWRAVEARLDEKPIPGGPYELVLSQLALHHFGDVPGVLARVADAVVPGGWVALADLDQDSQGAYHAHVKDFHGHHGFRREDMGRWLEDAGFVDVSFTDAGVVGKEVEGKRQDFTIFLAAARR